jgi:hypothetical protein
VPYSRQGQLRSTYLDNISLSSLYMYHGTPANGLRIPLNGSHGRRTPARLQARNYALGGAHAFGNLTLRQASSTSGGNQFTGHLEFAGNTDIFIVCRRVRQ